MKRKTSRPSADADRGHEAIVPSPCSMKQHPEGVDLQKARQALRASPFYGLCGLEVDFNDAGLVISGRVATFYQKQQAQEIVRAAATGVHVVNSVQVQD